MTEAFNQSSFQFELERKLDELITWAIANSPEKSPSLSRGDFAEACNMFSRVCVIGNDCLEREPEPSEGGAQYVNVTPAPWP